jgi:hypothetical protein
MIQVYTSNFNHAKCEKVFEKTISAVKISYFTGVLVGTSINNKVDFLSMVYTHGPMLK